MPRYKKGIRNNSGGIYGLAAGKDGVWTQFLCHGR